MSINRSEDGSVVYLTYDNLDWGCRMLATQLFREKKEFDCILTVTGEGLFVAHILSQFLKISEVWTIGLDAKTREFFYVPNPVLFVGQHVLVIDMACDTGEQFTLIREFLTRRGTLYPESLTLAVLFAPSSIKEQTEKPDYVFEYLAGDMPTFIFPWTKRE